MTTLAPARSATALAAEVRGLQLIAATGHEASLFTAARQLLCAVPAPPQD